MHVDHRRKSLSANVFIDCIAGFEDVYSSGIILSELCFENEEEIIIFFDK